MVDTPVLKMPLMASNQSQKHVTHNNALLELDVLVQLTVLNRTTSTPPSDPSPGDRYIVGPGATALWAGKTNHIAAWISGSWKFFSPGEGWAAYVLSEENQVRWDGSSWNVDSGGGGGGGGSSDDFNIYDATDNTKIAKFQLTAITTGTTRTYSLPNANGALATLASLNQTFSGPTTFSNATVTLGSSTANSNIGVGTGATASGNTKTINIGVGGADGSTTNINVGPTSGSSIGAFAVRSQEIIFNSADGDTRPSINKTAVAKDAGLVFQTNFNTRVIMGLLGDDDFVISVSPDAENFTPSMTIDRHTGNVSIGAGADSNNKLLVNGESMLFTNHENLRFTFNKGTAADDVALTFQSGYSARALVGLLGDDNFTFKVTPDGNSYKDAIVIDRNTAIPNFAQLPRASAYCNYSFYPQSDSTNVRIPLNVSNGDNPLNMFDSSNNEIIVPADGFYLISYVCAIDVGPGATLAATRIHINGVNLDSGVSAVYNPPASVHYFSVTAATQLSAGDSVSLAGGIASSAIDNSFFVANRSFLSVVYLSKN